MIREFITADLENVMQLWLAGNIQAHDFIPAGYWQAHFEAVKAMLPQAQLYIYEDGTQIQGFIGLTNHYIAGIFVRQEARCNGIGRQLLDFVKERYPQLTLNVYEKNARAVQFYMREGFQCRQVRVETETKETEYEMVWEKA